MSTRSSASATTRALFADPDFWNALKNTVGIFVLATVPQLLMALAMANLLNRKLRARTFFRMGVLIPNVTSVAAVGIVFGQLFARDVGLVNYVITRLRPGRRSTGRPTPGRAGSRSP